MTPGLPTTGRDQLAMTDRENACVPASCITDRVDLPVTDNPADFVTHDAERHDARLVTRVNGSPRQLSTPLHERADEVALTVAHPIDALDRLTAGFWPTPNAPRAVPMT